MAAATLNASAIRKFRFLETLTLISPPLRQIPHPLLLHQRISPNLRSSKMPAFASASLSTASNAEPLAYAEEALMGFITGRRKATEVAHSKYHHPHLVHALVTDTITTCSSFIRVWKKVVQGGDVVVDATCGNGHDTLALLKMIADESGRGCVYGMDIQNSALENTSYLLEQSVDKDERTLVKLFLLCHSKMEDIVSKDSHVRLIAFNLGYLPGGDKAMITSAETTLMALRAASRILMPGGLISMVVYVGHPGGRNELESVQSFVSSLPTDAWVCSEFEITNRPSAPILVLLYKK